MSLPASLLAAVEQHACFSGHYRHESEIQACIDPAQPVTRLYTVSCGDCLSFRPGVLASLLPVGLTMYGLADALSAHVRALRGYRWSVAGYFTAGGGFWLSAAYYGGGLFLVDASRNRNGRPDADVLADAFRLGVLTPEDPRMGIPSLYAAEQAYVNMASPVARVQSKQDLVASRQYSQRNRPGFARATILEFLPFTTAAAPNPASSPPAPLAQAKIARKLEVGEVCPQCGAAVKERPLFTGSFVGCLC
jgi:hypothetical protein